MEAINTDLNLQNPLWPILATLSIAFLRFYQWRKGEANDTSLQKLLSTLSSAKLPVVTAAVTYILSNTSLLKSLSDIWNKPEEPTTPKEDTKNES